MSGRAALRRTVAFGVGVGGTALVTASCLIFDEVPTTIPALLLLVPITVTGVLGGALVAVPVAIIAALTYAMAFLPPIGHIRIGLTEDVLVLMTFVAVALLVAFVSDIRRARAPGELIDDRRAVLLRGVSHDLRSPLTTIRSVSSDLLEGPEYDRDTRAAMLNIVVDESDRLDRIVGNLLSVTRIQAGALIPDLEPISISEIVVVCEHRFARLTGHFAHVESVIEAGLPDVLVDAVQVDQVLANLIENARRVAPPDSVVQVHVSSHDEGFIAVRVIDEGPGFATDCLDEVFDPFRSKSGSSGLGLAVCKAVVEAHGGTIAAGTSTFGGGVVTFTLPTCTNRPPPTSPRGQGS